MTSTITLISTCRRLLTSLQTGELADEARAAVDACDAWLEQHDPSRPAPELLHGILRAIHPEDQKTTLAACSLINKAWRRVAWSVFWKEVTLSDKFTGRKFVHPRTLKMMGGNLRSLKVSWGVSWHPSKEVSVRPIPAMAGLRMINLGPHIVPVEDVLSLFVHSPNLISLRATIMSEDRGSEGSTWDWVWGDSDEGGSDSEEGSFNGEDEDMYMNDVGREDYWENHPPGSRETWQGGFTKLKALHMSVACRQGDPLPSGLVLDMADSLGSNLESLELVVPGGRGN